MRRDVDESAPAETVPEHGLGCIAVQGDLTVSKPRRDLPDLAGDEGQVRKDPRGATPGAVRSHLELAAPESDEVDGQRRLLARVGLDDERGGEFVRDGSGPNQKGSLCEAVCRRFEKGPEGQRGQGAVGDDDEAAAFRECPGKGLDQHLVQPVERLQGDPRIGLARPGTGRSSEEGRDAVRCGRERVGVDARRGHHERYADVLVEEVADERPVLLREGPLERFDVEWRGLLASEVLGDLVEIGLEAGNVQRRLAARGSARVTELGEAGRFDGRQDRVGAEALRRLQAFSKPDLRLEILEVAGSGAVQHAKRILDLALGDEQAGEPPVGGLRGCEGGHAPVLEFEALPLDLAQGQRFAEVALGALDPPVGLVEGGKRFESFRFVQGRGGLPPLDAGALDGDAGGGPVACETMNLCRAHPHPMPGIGVYPLRTGEPLLGEGQGGPGRVRAVEQGAGECRGAVSHGLGGQLEAGV